MSQYKFNQYTNKMEIVIPGPQGIQGPVGAQGPSGPGIAIGGTNRQVLIKKSNLDFDTDWADFLDLDQTNPQTINNGIPLLNVNLSDFNNQKQLVTKEYVDNAVNFISDYYFNDTISAIGGIYYEMTNNDLAQGSSVLTKINLDTGNNQPFYNFITNLPIGTSKLNSGVYKVHFHARKLNGTKSVTLYTQIYTRTSGGVETLIATSQSSPELNSSVLEYDLEDSIHQEVSISPTDKLVVKFFANIGSSGSNVDVELYLEDDYNSRVSIPIESDILNQVYLRQDGAKQLTSNWNAGSFNITANRFLYSDGSAAVPALAFSGDADTGIFRFSENVLAFSTGGTERLRLFNGAIESAGQVRGLSGSASSPTFVFSNDTNTGMFGLGGDELAFSTNSSERVRITATGRVGVGTSIPNTSTKMEIYGGDLVVNAGASGNPLTVWYNVHNQSNSTLLKTGITAVGGSFGRGDLYFLLDSSTDGNNANITDDTKMVIKYDTGNVGIGTASPGQKLHISGSGARLRIQNTTSDPVLEMQGTSGISYLFTRGSNWHIRTDSTSKHVKLNVGDSAATQGYVQIGNGSAGDIDPTSQLSIRGNVNSSSFGLLSIDSYTGINRLLVRDDGLVGIGTSSPSTRLHVVSTSEQQRIGYDASNYFSTAVSAVGEVIFQAVGSGADFTFSNSISASNLSGTNTGDQDLSNYATKQENYDLTTITYFGAL